MKKGQVGVDVAAWAPSGLQFVLTNVQDAIGGELGMPHVGTPLSLSATSHLGYERPPNLTNTDEARHGAQK